MHAFEADCARKQFSSGSSTELTGPCLLQSSAFRPEHVADVLGLHQGYTANSNFSFPSQSHGTKSFV